MRDRVVETGLNTALIVEDDADWDVRLKTQMPTLARATRGYVQPLVHDTSQTLVNVTTSLGIPVLSIGELPDTLGPERSPYGDGWDVLWLGHCGTESPGSHESTWTATEEPPSSTLSSRPTPTPEWPPPLQITLPNDTTVPGPEHLKPHPFALPDPLGTLFPAHTRVVHAAGKTMCTQAYAVSQEGARRLLWQFGLETLTAGWDLMLRDWCADTYLGQPGASPRDHGPGKQRWGKDGKGDLLDAAWKKKRPVCLTVQPPLFSHRFGKGAASDMTAPGGGFVGKDKEMTPYIRLSVRMNLGRLVHGASMSELADQWPDDE